MASTIPHAHHPRHHLVIIIFRHRYHRDGACGVQVEEVVAPDQQRTLADYLALPVSQYSVLDPRFIRKDDSDGRKGAFILSVPLEEVMGVDLMPQLHVAVDVDPAAGEVRLEGRRGRRAGAKDALGAFVFVRLFKVKAWEGSRCWRGKVLK